MSLARSASKFCLRASVKHYFNRAYSSQNVPRKGDRVVVGMSGGVDSSVTARLLMDQDYDLSAVFMRNWDTRDESGTDQGCEWEKDWEDVQQVCKQLDIPCEMIDLSREYWNRVFEPSLKTWEFGGTPNPDVWCNREIKFGALLERLPIDSQSGKSWFATGHYARKSWATSPSGVSRPQLLRGKDPGKDQSYYLSSISEQGLCRALFPIGDLTKPEVRELAKKHNLPTAERAESMGLCFIGEKAKFSDFISAYIPPNPGRIIDMTSGAVIGKHNGLWQYTIGENARLGGMVRRMFVAHKDIDTNTVYAVPGTHHEALFCDALHVGEFEWIWHDAPPPAIYHLDGLRAHLKFRHVMKTVPCTVRQGPTPAELSITFDEPQKAIALGQVAALWAWDNSDWCLGCGIIWDTVTSAPLRWAGHGKGRKLLMDDAPGSSVGVIRGV